MAPLLTEEESALDPYSILSVLSTATEKEIRKAYRQQSLKYHPDRNPAPEAAIKFREISLSLEILVDVAKRQFVDNKLEGERRRKEKYAELDKKRKGMIDALNQREEDAKRAKVDAVRRKQQAAEEEEIKEAGKRMLEEAQKRAAAAAGAAKYSATLETNNVNGHVSEAGPSRPYQRNGNSSSRSGDMQPPISPEDLTLILQFPSPSTLPARSTEFQEVLEQRYGPINHLLLSEPPEDGKKKKKKGRKAVVEFKKGNWGGCWACWKDHGEVGEGEEAGRVSSGQVGRKLEDGVKVRWARGSVPDWVSWADRQKTQNGLNGSGEATEVSHGADGLGVNLSNGFPPGDSSSFTPPAFGSAPNLGTTTMANLLSLHASRKEQRQREEEFESMTLFRMRQMERERMEEEIRRAEEAEVS